MEIDAAEQDDNDIDSSFNVGNIEDLLLHEDLSPEIEEELLAAPKDAWVDYNRQNDNNALTASDYFTHLQAHFNDDDDENSDVEIDDSSFDPAAIFSAQDLPDDDNGADYQDEQSAYAKRKKSKNLLIAPHTKCEYITVNHKRKVNKRISTMRKTSKVIRTVTHHGQPALVYDGFMYRRRAISKDTDNPTVTWSCVKACNARITEKNEELFINEPTSQHTDGGDVDLIRARIILNEQKRFALESCMTPADIIGRTLQGASSTVQSLLPRELQQRRRINFFRNARDGLPSHPTIPSLLLVPDIIRMVNNELFLLYDNKNNTNSDDVGRIVILATKKNVNLLLKSKHLFIDGTFNICNTKTKLFTQLWTLHARVGDDVHPLVFVFMQRQTTNAYRHALQNVVQNRTAEVELITVDFEAAQAKAISEFFPNATLKGCFFHLVQIVNRRVRKAGLWKLYRTNTEFRTLVRMLPSMSHCEPDLVVILFQQYKAEVEQSNYGSAAQKAKFKTVLSHFEKQFIGFEETDETPARPPKFPLTMWVYGESYYTGNIPRSNGYVEGYHSVMNQILDARHKTLYYVMLHLKKLQMLTITRLGAHEVGKSRGLTRSRKWIVFRERIKKVLETFDGSPLGVLRALTNASAVAVADMSAPVEN